MDATHAEPQRGTLSDYFHLGALPFWAVHLVAIVGVAMTGWWWEGLLIALASYYFRMFFVTAAYHRYFSHRAFKTSRFFQFLLALGGATTTQKGALWWAAHHRQHHKYSDTPLDPHSPQQSGLLWAHVGWITSPRNNPTHVERIRDLTKYPELMWLNKYYLIPVVAYATMFFLIGGWPMLLWGYFVSQVLLWHGTFTINSLTHVWGKPRFKSGDDSKNHWFLAIVTMGEGWHNNHHHYQSTANQGFYWWEWDPSYYILKALSWVGIVWDLRTPPERVLQEGRKANAAEESATTQTEPEKAATLA